VWSTKRANGYGYNVDGRQEEEEKWKNFIPRFYPSNSLCGEEGEERMHTP
jgi:hypothetical protein